MKRTAEVLLCSVVFVVVLGQGSASAALQPRLNGKAMFDTDRGITWLVNANYARTYGYHPTGYMTWAEANAWVQGLVVEGTAGWRLPNNPNCTGYNCTGGEMGHMYYNILGGVAGQSLTTTHGANYNLFQDIQTIGNYWSGTEYTPSMAWYFYFAVGLQGAQSKTLEGGFAWAVHDGDVGTPTPRLPLTHSPETGYVTDGVNPDTGGPTTQFTFKTVYSHPMGQPPTSVQICLDGSCSPMSRDTGATDPILRDGDFTNGEQYTISSSGLAAGAHTYHFEASDGFNPPFRLPAIGELPGPTVVPAVPILSIELSAPDFMPEGSQPVYYLSLQNIGGSTATAPLTVTLEVSAGLNSPVVTANAWTCSSGPQAGQFTCNWNNDLPVGSWTGSVGLSAFLTGPSYAPSCGTGPSPCVSVRATPGTLGSPSVAYTGVDGVLGNSIPRTVDDAAVVISSPVTIDVAYNDWDYDGDPLTVTGIATPPANGQAVIEPDGKITYTPNWGSNSPGTDSFRYRVSDGRGATNTALVVINPAVVELQADSPLVDIGQVAVGRLAAGAMYVRGAVGTYHKVSFESVTAAEIATALAGTSHSGTRAVADPAAFRTYPVGGTAGYGCGFQYTSWCMTQVFFRPSTPGQVSVARAVLTSYAMDDYFGTAPLATERTIIVGVGSTLADSPVVAFDDTATTSVGTAVSIPVGDNDRPVRAGISEIGIQSDMMGFLFEGAAAAFARGTIGGAAGPLLYTPPTGFTGVDAFHYAISANCSTSPCPNTNVYHYATVTVTVGAVSSSADIAVTKTVSTNSPLVGSNVTFNVNATNSGPQNATGVQVTDLLPTGYSFVSASPGAGSYNSVTGIWSIGNLANGASVLMQIVATVQPTGNYTNVATVSASSPADPNAANNSASASTAPVAPRADIGVTKTVSAASPLVGRNVSFVIAVTNNGPQDATGVQVTDLLPTGYAFVSATAGAGSYNSTTGVWSIGSLAHHDGALLDIVATVLGTGNYTNTATLTASSPADPNTANNSASVSTAPTEAADIAVTKTVSNAAPSAGTNVTFNVTVINSGPQDATGVQVTDLLPSGYTFVSASPSAGSYSSATGLWSVGNLANGGAASLQIVATVLWSGDYTNTATRTASSPNDPITANNSASASTTPAVRRADLAATMVAGPAVVDVGARVTFGVTIRNDGPFPATNVTFTGFGGSSLDGFTGLIYSNGCSFVSPSTGITCSLGTIPPGGSAGVTVAAYPTATVSGLATSTSIFVSFPGSVSGSESDSVPANNAAATTINVVRPPGELTDGTQPVSISTPGGTVTLTFTGGVTTPGFTSVATSTSAPPLPVGFQAAGTFFEISTSARYTAPVTVCVSGSFTASDWIMHFENNAWVQLPNRQLLPPTGPPFTTLCAQTQSFSPFVVATGQNRPPVVTAGPDRSLDATDPSGAKVVLSGTGSDPDGDLLRFTWSGPCGTASTPAVVLTCPIGVNAVTLTASDERGGVAVARLLVTVRGALDIKRSVLAELRTLRAGVTDPEDAAKLDAAISSLTSSLEAGLWVDQIRINTTEGSRVFNYEKACAGRLLSLIAQKNSPIPNSVLGTMVHRIVGDDRLLAMTAIYDAKQRRPDRIPAALDAVKKGDALAAKGQAEEAIDWYRVAWEGVNY